MKHDAHCIYHTLRSMFKINEFIKNLHFFLNQDYLYDVK